MPGLLLGWYQEHYPEHPREYTCNIFNYSTKLSVPPSQHILGDVFFGRFPFKAPLKRPLKFTYRTLTNRYFCWRILFSNGSLNAIQGKINQTNKGLIQSKGTKSKPSKTKNWPGLWQLQLPQWLLHSRSHTCWSFFLYRWCSTGCLGESLKIIRFG